MMGASQIDRYGNQNISAVGDCAEPTVQLLGSRGAPGNTVNHTTSYWVPEPLAAGVRRAGRLRVGRRATTGPRAAGRGGPVPRDPRRRHEPRRARLRDRRTARMRLRSVHPGVTVDEVVAATGFELAVGRRRRDPAAHRRGARGSSATCSTRRTLAPRRCRGDPPGAAHGAVRPGRGPLSDRADRDGVGGRAAAGRRPPRTPAAWASWPRRRWTSPQLAQARSPR